MIAALRAAGVVLPATATSLGEGRAAAGIDAVVAQGYEAGGHRGAFDPAAPDDRLGTVALTRLLVRALDAPVIAAGGITDGAGAPTSAYSSAIRSHSSSGSLARSVSRSRTGSASACDTAVSATEIMLLAIAMSTRSSANAAGPTRHTRRTRHGSPTPKTALNRLVKFACPNAEQPPQDVGDGRLDRPHGPR